MPVLRTLLVQAARRIAADPRVQAKAIEIIETEVRPRAEAAWQSTRPKIAAARAELEQIARESDPRKDPRGFARKLRQRFLGDEAKR